MSVHVVGMKVPIARSVVTTLRNEVGAIDRMRDRLPAIVTQADDPFGTIALINFADEVSEETGGLATLVEKLANLSEAADLGMISLAELERLEGEVIDAFNPLSVSIGDGVGAAGTHAELMQAIHLGLVTPNERDQDNYDLALGLANGDFDLADAFVAGRRFPDGTMWDANSTTSGIDHIGGGAIEGPDGRFYPIVIPVATGPNGDQFTVGFDDPGWTQIGYVNGTAQFASDISPLGKAAVGFLVATGGDAPASSNDDGLPGLIYRNGLPPVLTQVPSTYDAVSFPGFSDLGAGGGAADLGVGAVQGITTFNNLNENVDRAYEVVFEQHESGAVRATVTTHSIGRGGDGNDYLTANHVFVTPDNELAQTPAIYVPQPGAPPGPAGIESAPAVPLREPLIDEVIRPHRIGGPIEVETGHLGGG